MLRKCNKELKVSGSGYGTKREINTANKDKYSISAMCHWLSIPHSSYYYKVEEPVSETEFEEKVKWVFCKGQSRYGARKIKKCTESCIYLSAG